MFIAGAVVAVLGLVTVQQVDEKFDIAEKIDTQELIAESKQTQEYPKSRK